MRTKRGIVTSAKMTGTVTVTVHRSVFHPMYRKRYRMSKKFLADSAGMDLGVGDEVVIAECRPISKNKHFKVQEILKSAPRLSDLQEEGDLEEALRSKTTKPIESPEKEAASAPASAA